MTDAIKEYRSVSVNEAAELISSAKKALIIFHVHPDGDSVGSAFALKAYIEHNGGEAVCVCADKLPERFAFIYGGAQEDVSIEAIPDSFAPDLTVSVDTASPSQMGAAFEAFGDKVDLMIDHHGKGTIYADYCIDPNASACGEVLYEILKLASAKKGEQELPDVVNKLIYTAISSDTGCFRYSNVSSKTHLVASALIGKGFDSSDVNHRLFGIKTLKQMQVEHAGFERMNLHVGGRVAIITFPYDLKAQYGADDEALETLIDVARCVKGAEIAVVIKQPTAENRFRVSMRSSCDFDVSEICALYGGGGHTRAAGCTITADSILSAEMTVVLAIEGRLLN